VARDHHVQYTYILHGVSLVIICHDKVTYATIVWVIYMAQSRQSHIFQPPPPGVLEQEKRRDML